MPTIKYEGHACFLITTDGGVRIITDPYEAGGFGGAIAYGPISDAADVVLVTHEHGDHNYVAGVPGHPVALRASGAAGGVEFRAVAALHGRPDGQDRGGNLLFRWESDGVRFCHLGDLGFLLDAGQVAALAPVDVVFVAVGGRVTLDGASAHQVVAQLQARVAIPMHYATGRTGFPLDPVDDFLRDARQVVRVGGAEWQVSAATLPETPTVVVLEAAN
jgi:L-ascorbate metabolism protein UlaG (beta-lactamase superfamily)